MNWINMNAYHISVTARSRGARPPPVKKEKRKRRKKEINDFCNIMHQIACTFFKKFPGVTLPGPFLVL